MIGGGGSEHRATFESTPRAAGTARRFVAARLQRLGADDDIVADFMLAVSEWVTNVAQHGDGGEVVVEVLTADPTWWEVCIDSPQPLPESLRSPTQWRVAGSPAPSGRGLGIVREVMDDVVVSRDGSSVTLRKTR